MRVNPKTLLFEDLSPLQAEVLMNMAAGMMDGTISDLTHPYLEEWITECGLENKNRLLLMATVFPAKALLSVCLYQDKLIEGYEDTLLRLTEGT